jgi:hypothetical protein
MQRHFRCYDLYDGIQRRVCAQIPVYAMAVEKGLVPFSKDTLYRLMNSCHIHWRQFTMLLSASIIADTIQPLTNEDRIQALILIDDTLFTRARSKKVETAC